MSDYSFGFIVFIITFIAGNLMGFAIVKIIELF